MSLSPLASATTLRQALRFLFFERHPCCVFSQFQDLLLPFRLSKLPTTIRLLRLSLRHRFVSHCVHADLPADVLRGDVLPQIDA